VSRKRRKLLESTIRDKTRGHDWSSSSYNRDHGMIQDQKTKDHKKERDIPGELKEASA